MLNDSSQLYDKVPRHGQSHSTLISELDFRYS